MWAQEGGYEYEQAIKRVLTGLGFPPGTWDQSLAQLSGGQKTRVLLARLLLERPDLLILDEIVFCLAQGLTAIQDIERLIRRKNPHVEIVMTGRGATQELIDLADLVTEMKKIKHPFDKGLTARIGIEY